MVPALWKSAKKVGGTAVVNSRTLATRLWKSAKKVGGTASSFPFYFFLLLWKSAKKVGGTAMWLSICCPFCAVEICQKGGWNSPFIEIVG